MHSSVVINLGGIFGPVWLTDQCLQKMTPPTSDFLYLLVKSAQIYLLFTLLIHWHIYHSAQKLLWFGPMNDQRYLSGNTLHKKQLIVKVAWAESWASWCPPAFLYAPIYAPIAPICQFTGQRGRSKNHNKTKTTYCKLEGGIIWIECDWRNLIFSKN